MKRTIQFLCTGNSCRSQMAEGWTRHLWSDLFEVISAGTQATRVDPIAVRVMKEVGVDISNQRSKHIRELGGIVFDYVITVCDNARENCPFHPAKVRLLHKGFDDPPQLAVNSDNMEEKVDHYRRVLDEIRSYIEKLPELLDIDIRKGR